MRELAVAVLAVIVASPNDTAVSTPHSAGAGGEDGGVIESHTSIEGGTITLRTNVTNGADADGDGLADAWEDLVLLRLRPFVRLDEEEPPVGATGIVGRVTPVGEAIVAFMMLGYARDLGSCGLSAHEGDSERVVLELERIGPGDVRVSRAYTAAHEGAPTDRGRVTTELLHEPDASFGGEPRWVVFASERKHATYATPELCEGASVFPCFQEDCDGGVTLLMPYVNAGEPDRPLVTDLALFPGDHAWARQDFCGGLGGTRCAGAVRDKLTRLPF